MRAFTGRISKGTMRRLVSGSEVYAGLITVSDEPEVRIGLTIAGEMGCFDCHGPMGAGGVANPGTVGGQVPGFYGTSFTRQSKSLDGIEGIVRDGRPARRAWWMPWKRPALDMPAYGDRLDSVEIQLLAHAIRSLSYQDD
jgi:mono/diheme cytochrome c family protein